MSERDDQDRVNSTTEGSHDDARLPGEGVSAARGGAGDAPGEQRGTTVETPAAGLEPRGVTIRDPAPAGEESGVTVIDADQPGEQSGTTIRAPDSDSP
jgi:hypothetical protein